MKKRILFTGSTGFIGGHLLNLLLEQDVEIILIIRKDKESLVPKSDKIINVIKTENLFKESESWWEEICKEIDIVIHLAWYVKHGEYLNSDVNFECTLGTLNLAKSCVKNRIKRFIGFGTCFEYDLDHKILSINTPLNPKTFYSSAKVSTFYSLSYLFAMNKISFIWCRLFYLYGEGENENRLVPYVRGKILKNEIVIINNGSLIRDYIEVNVAALQIFNKVFSDEEGAFNICSGQGVTIKDFVINIADEYKRRDLLIFNDTSHLSIEPTCIIGIP